MLTLNDLLFGVLVPAVLGMGLTRATYRWMGGAIGVVAGYIFGHVAVASVPAFPAHTTEQWLPYLGLLCLGGVALTRVKQSDLLRWGIAVGLFLVLVIVTLEPLVRHSWGWLVTVGWGVGLLVTMTLIWKAQAWAVSSFSEEGVAGIWVMVIGGTGLVCAFGGSQKLGQLGGALTGAWIGVCLAMLLGCRGTLVKTGFLPAILIWAGILVNGYLYASVPIWAALLVLLSALTPWIAALGLPTHWSRRARATFAAAAAAIWLLAALIPMGIALAQSLSDQGGYSY